MASLFFIGTILLLLSSLVSSAETPAPATPILVSLTGDGSTDKPYKCGQSIIITKLEYCTPAQACDRTGIISSAENAATMVHKKPDKKWSFALCDDNEDMNSKLQVRINKNPNVWKNADSIKCIEDKDTKNVTVVVKFTKDLQYNPQADRREYALRCVSAGKARFDVYHFNELDEKEDANEGVYLSERYYIVYLFVSLCATVAVMAVHYALFLYFENQKLTKSVIRRNASHDELWLTIERSERKPYDAEEIWNAMPLIHQQVAVEAALFIQKYKTEKFTPHLRQWIVDRAYPAGATEIILELAGLSDPDCPFYAPIERPAAYKNEHKMSDYSERIESRIVDTLNYANRLRRRKIVFTDHRFLDLHHIILELGLTTLGSPSHPTIHDANIPVLPRHAFGTRDDPREDEKEEKEAAARSRRPHFLHHDWDEAQRLLGSEA